MYLNRLEEVLFLPILDLTLTRVVFEYEILSREKDRLVNLTLTRVVFEYHQKGYDTFPHWFNFNKSCIWIPAGE